MAPAVLQKPLLKPRLRLGAFFDGLQKTVTEKRDLLRITSRALFSGDEKEEKRPGCQER
jgi:hypothetical protein